MQWQCTILLHGCFISRYNNRHPIARPWGPDMGCLLWVHSLNYTLYGIAVLHATLNYIISYHAISYYIILYHIILDYVLLGPNCKNVPLTNKFCRLVLPLVDKVFERLFHGIHKLVIHCKAYLDYVVQLVFEICKKQKHRQFIMQYHQQHLAYESVSIINSLAPGRCCSIFKLVIFKLISRRDLLSISYEIALRWMSQDLAEDYSTVVQVMAWCRQAASHYLHKCWPRSMSPYGVSRPQWVKSATDTSGEGSECNYPASIKIYMESDASYDFVSPRVICDSRLSLQEMGLWMSWEIMK